MTTVSVFSGINPTVSKSRSVSLTRSVNKANRPIFPSRIPLRRSAAAILRRALPGCSSSAACRLATMPTASGNDKNPCGATIDIFRGAEMSGFSRSTTLARPLEGPQQPATHITKSARSHSRSAPPARSQSALRCPADRAGNRTSGGCASPTSACGLWRSPGCANRQ